MTTGKRNSNSPADNTAIPHMKNTLAKNTGTESTAATRNTATSITTMKLMGRKKHF